jgi:alginate O-acetyltransferase complex protein AlgI
MSFTSLQFLTFAIVAIILAHVSNGRVWRPWTMLALSLTFVATAMAGWQQAMLLGGFCLFVLLAVVAVDGGRGRWLLPVVAVAVAVFVWLKQYTLVSDLAPLPAAVGLAGVSYILFRGIHLIVDVADGALKRPGALAMVNYLLFFPTFISGPIERFEDVEPQLMRRGSTPDEAETFAAMIRVIFGCLKVTLISTVVLGWHESALGSALEADGRNVAQYFFLAAAMYAIYLYVNFSGYMDIVVPVARLMGIRISENFDHPFSSRSFLEFWTRWHITLSNWFRFYLFNPILKVMTLRWPAPALAPYLGVFAFFVTFLAMGIWHGTTGMFIVYGFALGLGVSGNRLYQVVMTQWLGRKKYAALASGRFYEAIARGVVFAYFSLAVSCFFLSGSQVADLCARTGLWLLPAWLGLVFAAAVILLLWDTVEGVAGAISRRAVDASSLTRSAVLAVALVLFISVQIWDNSPPPVLVYRGF